jgi:hypothetical protein
VEGYSELSGSVGDADFGSFDTAQGGGRIAAGKGYAGVFGFGPP